MHIHNLTEKNSILNTFISELRDVNIQKDSMRFRRNIERIGDQSQNIAEAVYTMITGKPFQESDMLKNVHPI